MLRRYHISKASLMRWNRLYDGTKESLMPKSHRPHTPHPNAPHRGRIELDPELPSPQSQHQHVRIVRQTPSGESLQPTPGVIIPCVSPARIPAESGIHQEEIQASGSLRYAHGIGQKVANGCKICADSLLCGDGR